MEEILASIRKIISEDSNEPTPAAETKPAPAPAAETRPAPAPAAEKRPAPAPAAEMRPAPAPAPAPVEAEEDVLELTQEIQEEAPQAAPAYVPEPAAPPPENDVVFETIEEPAVMNEAPLGDHDGIFSDKTRKAMEDTFANIEPEAEEAPYAAAAAPAPVAPLDGRTVEAVFERAVREAFDPVVNKWLGTNADAIVERMKPLIREWMDEHFPALLEGAVRNEVARVVKARGTKR
jgi:cell pole-organizing protein PopZ